MDAEGQSEMQNLQAGGYSPEEIAQWRNQTTQQLKDGGFSDNEVSSYFGDQPKVDMSQEKNYVSKNVQTYMNSEEYKNKNPLQHEAKSFWEALQAGFQNSTFGLAWRDKMPDTVVTPDQNMAYRIASQIGTFGGDLPAMTAGASFGGGFGAGVGGLAAPVTAPIGAMAGAFAAPQALRKMLIDHYQRGDISSADEFAHRLMATSWEAIKGAGTGAATAAAGGLAAPAGALAKFGTELATMTTMGKALEGQLPSKQDFIDGAILLGGVHAATKLMNIYAKTGQTPDQVAEVAQKDPALKQDILSIDPKTPSEAQDTELQHFSQKEGTIPTTEEQAKGIEKEIPPVEKQWDLVNKTEQPPGPPGEPPDRTDFEKRVMDSIVMRPEKPATEFDEKLSKGVDALNVAVKDNLSPIKNLVDATTDTGDLEPSKNPYMLARLNRDVGGKILTAYADHTFDFNSPATETGEGLSQILKDVPEKDFQMLDAYLKSKRVIFDPKQRDQGISLDDAKALVEKNSDFEPIAQRLYDFQNRMKQYAVDSGILSPEKSDLFDRTSQNYAPLYKLLDVDPLTEQRAGGKSLFQKMLGSDRQSISSIQGIFENTAAIIKAAEKNRILTALTQLPDLEENGLARKVDPDETPVGNGKNIITVKVDGDPVRWAFQQDVADAVKAMDYSPEFTSLWAKMFIKPFNLAAKGLRIGVTGTPGFALFHGFRATVAADIQSKYPGLPFIGILDAIGEQFGHSDEYWKFISSGAANTGFEKAQAYLNGENWGHDSESLLQQAKDFAWPESDDPFLKKAWNAIWTPVRASEALTQILDNAPRFREFKRGGGLQGDLNQQIQAAFDARNVSVDYQRYGALTKLVSFAQPFLNVDMQGTFKALEGLKDPSVIARALAIITLPEIVNYVINKDDERYKNAPLWEHGAFMDVPINWWKKPSSSQELLATQPSMKRQLPDGSWEVNVGPMIRIPRCFTLGMVFGAIPHMILNKFYNQNPRAFDNLGEQVAKVIAPMGMTTLFQPVIEQKTNRNLFAGRPLVPDFLQKELPAYQFEPYTSEVAKQVGKIIGHLPQIGPKDSQLASPIVIDNYIKDWGGTLGGYVVNLLDKGLHEAGVGSEQEGPAQKWTEIPEIKRFFSHFPSTKAQSIEDFRSNFSELTQTQATMKALSDRAGLGDKGAMADYMDMARTANPVLEKQMAGVQSAITQGGKALGLIQKNPQMTPTDKRQLMDTITWQMINAAEQGNKMYNQVRGK